MDFSNIKDRARKLIHDDAKRDAHIIKERVADRNNSKYFAGQPNDAFSQVTTFADSSVTKNTSVPSQSYYDDSENRLYEDMDNRMQQYMEMKKMPQQQVTSSMPSSFNKNLPKEILESFSENYIDENMTMGVAQLPEEFKAEERKKGVLNEEQMYQQRPSQSIDYELIKNIVEGCVKKYINALGKKIISENKTSDESGIKAIQFTGDKFIIVNKNGDVYEANMQFKKNISKDK